MLASLGKFSILLLICMNCVPCRGLVKKLPIMLCVGQKDTLTSPFLILSVTTKYLMLRCLVCLLLDPFPFSVSNMVLLLSWYILVAVVVLMPCPFRKFRVHRICPITSSIATNSASVELFAFSFCLHYVLHKSYPPTHLVVRPVLV